MTTGQSGKHATYELPKETKWTLADRIEKRIREIPVSGGGYISVCQEYLCNTLARSLLRKIAEEAAAEAETPPR